MWHSARTVFRYVWTLFALLACVALASAPGSRPEQLREGAELVDQLGQFKISADRVLFVPADGRRQLIGLENLNLERVLKAVTANPQAGTWMVTGTVTEYRANNYILIRRAILKSRVK
jgi:hypothetical protein